MMKNLILEPLFQVIRAREAIREEYRHSNPRNAEKPYNWWNYSSIQNTIYNHCLPDLEYCKIEFLKKFERGNLPTFPDLVWFGPKFVATVLWLIDDKEHVGRLDVLLIAQKMYTWHLENNITIIGPHISWCKPLGNEIAFIKCITKLLAQWRQFKKEFFRIKNGQCRCGKLCSINKKTGKRYLTCTDCLVKNRISRRSYRSRVLEAYGPRCNCCGLGVEMLLTVDHIKNNGAQHRRMLAGKSIYKELVEKNFPKDYQILCFNCNCGKHLNGGLCPCPSAVERRLKEKNAKPN